MDLATTRYQAADLIEASGRAAVGITRWNPRWKLRYPVIANLRQLAPTREMLAIGDACIFDKMYQDRLDDLGVDGVSELFTMCVERANNERLVLACYEDLTTPGLRCHRRLFADWWTANTGEFVPELDSGVCQNRLFE